MQEFFSTLFLNSVTMSLVTLIYAAILPVLSKRYAAKWCYIGWIIIAVGWVFPLGPQFDFLLKPMQFSDIPLTSVHTIISANPTMPVQDVINTPASILLWWIFLVIWVLGSISIAAYHIWRYRYFLKLVSRWSIPIAHFKCLKILDGLKLEMNIKKNVELRECQIITSPMLVGFFRPVILLPSEQFSDDELSMILKHELVHLKRHDLWYKALILMATVLHWFNPIVYLMSRSVAAQCEISCDAIVIQGADLQRRKQYAEAIINVVKNGAKLQTAFSTNFYGGRNMKSRILSIMDTKQKKTGIIILCMTMLGVLMTGAAMAAATDSQESIRPEVVVASLNSNKDTDNEVTQLLKLLRRPYDDKTNAINSQGPTRPEVVAASPNSDNNSDNAVTHLLELLKQSR
ncbi:M56 family metallopeptidase [Paenibacillus sp. sgz500992]|uniref:M56 family metallopeptidase n=1 Tax=Paenibacillus sp. sgz500992 TaxID=3242476 RepID=UPI0036D41A04